MMILTTLIAVAAASYSELVATFANDLVKGSITFTPDGLTGNVLVTGSLVYVDSTAAATSNHAFHVHAESLVDLANCTTAGGRPCMPVRMYVRVCMFACLHRFRAYAHAMNTQTAHFDPEDKEGPNYTCDPEKPADCYKVWLPPFHTKNLDSHLASQFTHQLLPETHT